MMRVYEEKWLNPQASLRRGSDADRIEGHAKTHYDKNFEILRTKQTEAWEYFHKLKGANESAWAELKDHMDKAGEEVKDAVERMKTKSKQ